MARLWLPYDFHTADRGLLTNIIFRSIAELKYSNAFKDMLSGMLSISTYCRFSLKTVLSHTHSYQFINTSRELPTKTRQNENILGYPRANTMTELPPESAELLKLFTAADTKPNSAKELIFTNLF